MNRIKRALRFNEPQISSSVLLSALMLAAYLQRDGDHSVIMAIAVCLFWPLMAFISNLIDPLP